MASPLDDWSACALAPPSAVAEFGSYVAHQMIGVAGVILQEHDLFELSPDGPEAMITPFRCSDPIGFESGRPLDTVLHGDIVDLVAWHPDSPGQWATRRGVATVLGCIEPQLLMPPPVQVHRNIWRWMLSGFEGLVILTADRRQQAEILRQIDVVVAEDASHRAELQRIASTPIRTPTIIQRRAA